MPPKSRAGGSGLSRPGVRPNPHSSSEAIWKASVEAARFADITSASNFVEEEKKARQLKKRFKDADTDGDGTVNLREFIAFLQVAWPDMSDSEGRLLFNKVDTNGSGRIEFDKFVDYVFAPKKQTDKFVEGSGEGLKEDVVTPEEAADIEMEQRCMKAGTSDLGPCGTCEIGLTEERGITLAQLVALLAHISRRCLVEEWISSNPVDPCAITPDTINLYDAVYWVVKPATRARRCSYVELVAVAAQIPRWFVSHWWGERIWDFVACLRQHTLDYKLDHTSSYWVCAYANNQWSLETDICRDPAKTSFRKAMLLAEGTVSIIDPGAVCYTRIWCAYEVSVSLPISGDSDVQCKHEETPYKYVIYTSLGNGDAVGIADGLAPIDRKRFESEWVKNKIAREQSFPTTLAQAALHVRLQDADASKASDKKHILNAIVGGADLKATPPLVHKNYDTLNNALHGRFAVATWRVAFKHGDDMSDYHAALKDSGLDSVQVCMSGCADFNDVALKRLLQSLPRKVRRIDLECNGLPKISDLSIEALGQNLVTHRQDLTTLKLRFSECCSLSSIYLLARATAQFANLNTLQLKFGGCERIASVEALGRAMMNLVSLRSLSLSFWGCKRLDALDEVGQGVSSLASLTNLYLDFSGCEKVTSVEALWCGLGKLIALTTLYLDFENCIGLTSVEKLGEGASQLKALTHLELRFARTGLTSVETLGRNLLHSVPTYLLVSLKLCSKLPSRLRRDFHSKEALAQEFRA